MDRNYLKNAATYLITTLLSLILVVYLIHQFRAVSSDLPEMKIAINETVIDSFDVSGYLFLSETVLEYEGDGIAIANVVDGTTVSVTDIPAAIYRSGDENFTQKAAGLLTRIDFLKKCSSIPDRVSDDGKYDREVKDDYISMIEAAENGNLSLGIGKTYDYFSSRTKRAVAIKLSDGYSKNIASLESERNDLLKSADKIKNIVAGSSGIYYAQTDGYESLMSPQVLLEGYDSVRNAILEVYKSSGKTEEAASGTKSAGKIITRGKWYYVCPIQTSDIDKLTPERKYTLSFNEDNLLKVDMVYQKTLTSFGEEIGYAVFYSNVVPEDLSLSRFKSATIEIDSRYGMYIPKTAIRYVDGKVGVYVADSNKARFRVIDIIGESSGSVIVRPGSGKDDDGINYLALYETVITSSKDLYDGKYIDLSS